MAELHPTQSGFPFQEGRPEDSRPETGIPPGASPCASPVAPGVTPSASRDYVVLASHVRRLRAQLGKITRLLDVVERESFRQPRSLWGGEVRSYYLAPRQVVFERACFEEHGVESLPELLDRCHDLLTSRPSDPVLDLALETLRDARLVCRQWRRICKTD